MWTTTSLASPVVFAGTIELSSGEVFLLLCMVVGAVVVAMLPAALLAGAVSYGLARYRGDATAGRFCRGFLLAILVQIVLLVLVTIGYNE